MNNWTRMACLVLGTWLGCASAEDTTATPGAVTAGSARAGTVVDIKPYRIYLLDIATAGDPLVAVGERGFVLISDDVGKSWKAIGTPVVRGLTGVAFNGDKIGVAVGHGGSLVRTEDGGSSWMAGVMVRLNLFNGGATKAKVAQAEADKAIIEEQVRKQRQQIELQVKTAQLNLETARKRMTLAEKAIKSASESLEMTRARFGEGLLLSTQLIDAETVLTGMRVRLSGARAEEQIALAELRHALGLPIRNLSQTSK